ncbi:MAG: hypothetical protein ACTS1X_08565 [Parasphingopyxis sp.]|uniref:hypothetical protein n=1 Tax=Parasphingopyxis sp. TaxID=1920299 RepID=UPI003F9F44CC
MTVYDFDPSNLPDDYLRAVGLVVVSATETEAVMRDFIGALLGIDNIESIAICAQMPFRLKDDIIRTLNELKAPSASELDNLDDILDQITEAIERRNAIAHSSFPIHPETGQVFRFKEKARRKLSADWVEVTVEELLSIAKEVHEAGLALQGFMAERGLGPRKREEPLREPISRKKKARDDRRAEYGEKY